MTDEVETQEAQEGESGVIRALRQQLKAAHKEITALNAELDGLQAPVVTDADIEGDGDEAVTEAPAETQGESAAEIEARVKADLAAQQALADVSSLSGRISSAASGAVNDSIDRRLAEAQTPEAVAAIMAEAELLHRG